jgi:hypothetical protein
MTALRLRKGWRSVTEAGVTYLYPPVPINVARPNGSSDFQVFNDAEEAHAYLIESGFQGFNDISEAHAYLIENGSESPWEEVC